MVSRVMFAESALSTTARNRGLSAISLPPSRAATVISRISLVKILPRLASCAALRWRIFDHLLRPAISSSYVLYCFNAKTALWQDRRFLKLQVYGCLTPTHAAEQHSLLQGHASWDKRPSVFWGRQ